MECNQVEDKLIDYLEGNLSLEENKLVSLHFQQCPACRLALQQTRALLGMMGKLPLEAPPAGLKDSFDKMLQNQQQQTQPVAIPARLFSLSRKLLTHAAAAALFLVAGYWLGTRHSNTNTQQQISNLEKLSQQLMTERTLALLDNRSASKRIQAVNYSEEMQKPEVKVLQAIITRLHNDENVNVRLAAAEALWKFKNEEMVREALIQALETETSPDVQIAVIEFLIGTQEKRAVAPLKKLLSQPNVPKYVKDQVNYGLTKIL